MEAAAKRWRRSSSFFQFFVFSLSILLLLTLAVPNVSASKTSHKSAHLKAYRSYIKKACDSATYPKECYQSLSKYAHAIKTDPEKLYRVSLFVTIRAARTTSSSISSLWRRKSLSPTDRAIVRDCGSTVSDAIDEMKNSLTVMANIQGADRQSELIDNIRKWVSAALTDTSSCTDEFDGQNVSYAVNKNIKKTVLNLSKMTSNCLALLNALPIHY
ncbi:pectinmethylesterase inhibitor 4 [Hibiscus trionum]|uniref:pectinesterase n=1 Tax=Hibiscus trionum TaxID=183268 RepID=A0A9W7MQ61_HIBTR|nr:pectinmethylesterase inhibitor 4 [Hibiscus trionum]